MMKDSEARGLVLKALYPIRHTNPFAALPADVQELHGMDINVLRGILKQLTEKGLVSFQASSGGHNMIGRGHITAYGVDVIEETTAPPISIAIDNSISVLGSQGVQIGGNGNVQKVAMDFEKMITAIDSGTGTIAEKDEAKSLLRKIAENPLVKSAIDWWVKSHVGA